MRLAVMTVVLALANAASAQPPQDPCERYLWFNGGKECPPGVERGGGKSVNEVLRALKGESGNRRAREPLGPILPGPGGNGASFMPPQVPTKEGPMGMDDLHLVPDGRGGYRGSRPGYKFDIENDGTIHFHEHPPFRLAGLGLLSVAVVFDLTDLVMQAAHIDPYSYDKGRVAEMTRAMRDEMNATERPRRIARALARLPGELEALWRRSDLAATERREILFQLWDDLLDGSTGPEGEAAQRARREILRFIARALPAGSRDAFSREELARFNARRKSHAAFAPYP
jgi:hypothetical protein